MGKGGGQDAMGAGLPEDSTVSELGLIIGLVDTACKVTTSVALVVIAIRIKRKG